MTIKTFTVKFADLRELSFNYTATFNTHAGRLTHDVETQFAVFLKEMADRGWSGSRNAVASKRRIKYGLRHCVDQCMFEDRFAPVRQWLETDCHLIEAARDGKFAGTHVYRLTGKHWIEGFTITFGDARDAALFRLRWGGCVKQQQ